MFKRVKDLIVLRGSDDDAILASSRFLRPLYVLKSATELLRWLSLIPKKGFEEEDLPARLSPIVRSLVSHGILIREDESRLFRNAEESLTAPRRTISLYLLLTHRCNLRCVYCLNGQQSYLLRAPPKMTLPVALAAGDRYLSMLGAGGRLEVVFFGGEPLLNWPLCKAIVAEYSSRLRPKWPDREIHYHLTSNLALCPPDLPAWAAENNVSVLCDVDGDQRLHDMMRPTTSGKGSYRRIKNTIRRLLDAGVPVALRATATSQNVKLMPEISQHHHDLGGHGSAFVAVTPVNSDEETLADDLFPVPTDFANGISRILENKTWPLSSLFPANQYAGRLAMGEILPVGCGAPYGNTPTVDAFGNIYPCHYLVGITRFCSGNVFDGNVQREREISQRLVERLDVDLMETCRECVWRYLCGGGCPVMRLTVKDNPRASERAKTYAREIVCVTCREVGARVLWHAAKQASESFQKWESDPTRLGLTEPIVCAS